MDEPPLQRQPSSFDCPSCGASLGARLGAQSKHTVVQCPECGAEFAVKAPPEPKYRQPSSNPALLIPRAFA